MTHWAPAAILRTSLKYCGISSRSWRLNGETTQPMKKLVFGSVSGLPPRPGTLEPLVHRPQQRDQADRVEVEHRLGPAAEAAGRIVAGDGQDVLEALGGVAPGGRFQAVAVHVLAGQVQDDAAAALGHQPGRASRAAASARRPDCR